MISELAAGTESYFHEADVESSDASHINGTSSSANQVPSLSNAKETNMTQIKSPIDRFPLRSLDSSLVGNMGNNLTPSSNKSKKSHGSDYDYTSKYVVSLERNSDDDCCGCDEKSKHSEEFVECNNHISTYSIDIQDSIDNYTNTSASRRLDYDSSMISGYEGSISAADWDDSVDIGHEKDSHHGKNNIDDCDNDININTNINGCIGNREISLKRNNHVTTDLSLHTDNSNTIHSSFMTRKKKLREKRRKRRSETEKAHRASILTEFRAFLSNNKKPGQKSGHAHTRLEEQNGDQSTNHKNPQVNENEDAALRTPNMKRVRGQSSTQELGSVPWIVFENDRDEDLSTLNGGSRYGGGGSSCVGSPGMIENDYHEINHYGIENPHHDDDFASENKSNALTICLRDRFEAFYICLIILSVATVAAVVTFVVMINN